MGRGQAKSANIDDTTTTTTMMMSGSGKETRTAASGRSPTKDLQMQPVVLVEAVDQLGIVINKGESDPETNTSSSSHSGNTSASRLEFIGRRNGSTAGVGNNGSGSTFKLEDLLPESGKELLGSVTFAPIRGSSSSSTSSGPVRTSARVIQKMRQDNRPSTPPIGLGLSSSSGGALEINSQPTGINCSGDGNGITNATACLSGTVGGNNGGSATTAAAAATSSILLAGSGSSVGTTGASSSTTAGTSTTVAVTKPEKVATAPKTPTTNQSKQPKRLWSNMERSLFFEALNEYGKDFEAITQHINQKMRRKVYGAETSCKSRDQIRHMYLQTFQKASRYLRFSDGECLDWLGGIMNLFLRGF